jgi:hypothetical protein
LLQAAEDKESMLGGTLGYLYKCRLIYCILYMAGLHEHQLDSVTVIFWERMLPSVSIPSTLKVSVSPMEGTTIADEYAAVVKSAMNFPTTSSMFCNVAGLICDEDIDIHSYATKAANATSTTTTTQGHKHASRAIGITTINDFQLGFFLEEQLENGEYMHLADNLFNPISLRTFQPNNVAETFPALTTTNLPELGSHHGDCNLPLPKPCLAW